VRDLMRSVSVVFVASLIVLAGVIVAEATGVSLRAQVLSVNQLPSGWLEASDTGNTGAGCLANLLEPPGVDQTAVAEVYFVHSGELPFLDEKLVTYSNTKRAFAEIASAIAECHHPSGPYKGYEVAGTVTKWHFAKEGNASVAYQMVFTTTTHVTIDYDYVIARKKNVVVALLEGCYPAVSKLQFSQFEAMAMAKVTS
jgi:hypothetical protein